MRILDFGSDYAHERKLREENKKNVKNSTDSTSVIPESIAREMGLLPDNDTEAKTKETQEKKKENKRDRKAKEV